MHEVNYIVLFAAVVGMFVSAANYRFAPRGVRWNRAYRRVWPWMLSFKVSEVRQLAIVFFVLSFALACFAVFVPLGAGK